MSEKINAPDNHPAVERTLETDSSSPDFGRVKDVLAAQAIAQEVNTHVSNNDRVADITGRPSGNIPKGISQIADRETFGHVIRSAHEQALNDFGGVARAILVPVRPNLTPKKRPWTLKGRIFKARRDATRDYERLTVAARATKQ